ncbi:hypothetical protein [Actinomadura sp. B10D3]|uniref:hypothetical protein n=1 Tax=Actinomadura sp. B10D3 TaxID=3153557 RepID=UPI00325E7205
MSGETSHQAYIGPYRLLSRLGGGTGDVHRATGPDGGDVAIRMLPEGAAPDVERMREVISPHVVDVLDGEPAGPRPYVVTRFVPGRPLGETIAARGPMSGDALRLLALGLARALAAIHRAGLAHGGLGPETVLVVDDAPVVVDIALTAGAGPADDVRAWAATVTFAATGRPDAPAGSLPAALGPLVAAATHPDPQARPAAGELAEAASRLDLPPASDPRPATPPSHQAPSPPAPTNVAPPTEVARGRESAVVRGWARLLAAMVAVIGVGVVVMAPIAGLVLTLAAVTLLRVAGTAARGWAWAFGRTLLTVPYAAVFAVAVPLCLAAASVAGVQVDPLAACAFGAGAGAAALWTAPGVSAPVRRLERMFLPVARRPRAVAAVARRPRAVAAAALGLGVLCLLAGVGAVSLTPSFSPMYGLQQTLESAVHRFQHAVDRW